MSRRSSNPRLIRGDDLEQHRIQLENNLQQHTDLSLHLSSAPDDDCSDVEYPRHYSAPSPFSAAFASFEQRSGDLDDQSQYHAWSQRSLIDDEGIHPFAGGETFSTAAHHASALTLSAGLGGRGARRDVSLSGAEYDPDRPLQGIMAGITSRFSGMDMDSTNTRHIASKTLDFDPLVVDDTAELDRVLQSGHAAALNLRSPLTSSQSSSSGSEPASPNPMSRPKLSDTLNRAAFSPKRPRSALGHLSPQSRSSAPLPPLLPQYDPSQDRPPRASSPFSRTHHNMSTPKAARQNSRLNQSLSYVQPSLPSVGADPEVNVQPPTPSVANSSKFTRMARGLARELEHELDHMEGQRANTRPAVAQSTIHGTRGKHTKERGPFKNIVNTPFDPNPTPAKESRTPFKGRVHLPDVTGLTSAVESPAKAGLEYYGYDARFDRETEVFVGPARVMATLNTVQNKLLHLEGENSISRRRVRELELELESCKQDVARERTKVLEREASMSRAPVKEQAFVSRTRLDKGNPNGQQGVEPPQAADEQRYKQAVEDKKALEALIATLRAHLARLTSELSDHHRLLEDLRSTRESDSRALSEKSKDVDKLRQEVERLAGEVEVLRGVVEEGLKERREAREHNSRELSHVSEDRDEVDESAMELDDHRTGVLVEQDDSDVESSDGDGHSTVSSARRSPTPSPRRRGALADRTVRTDHATLGSSLAQTGMSTRPFVDEEELQRISMEVEERRSERSASMQSTSQFKNRSLSSSTSSRLSARSGSPAPLAMASRVASNPNISMHRAASPVVSRRDLPPPPPTKPGACDETNAPPTRPTAPTPAHALGKGHPSEEPRSAPRRSRSENSAVAPAETPFPQIRGTQLERLFFSAPEHNAQTCTICHRRRRHKQGSYEDQQQTPFWTTGRRDFRGSKPGEEHQDDDEGFAAGPEDRGRDSRPEEKGKAREYDRRKSRAQGGDKVPPQTVLSRVLRELEDDFTHYKSIYVELADQYKGMDAVSNVAKRNVLAEHLREVIDILEQKGDQIASLYDLLSFHDKPTNQSVVPEHSKKPVAGGSLGRTYGSNRQAVVS